MKLLQNEDSSALQRRTIFLIVEGLYAISNHFGDNMLLLVVNRLESLAQDYRGLMVVCCTSSVSAPLESHLDISRIRKSLTCSPLEPPKIDNEPVFKTNDLVWEVLINDCGGHGRALEVLADVFKTRPTGIGPDFKFLLVKELLKFYGGAIPEES